MDKRTIARINAHENSLKYLQDNAAVYQGFVPLEESITSFRLVLLQVADLSNKQNKTITGSAAGKKETRLEMTSVAVSLAKKAIVWARKLDRWSEIAILDIEQSDLMNGELLNAVDSAKNVLKVLNDNKADLGPYRIGQDQLTELQNAITEMGVVETAPRQSRDQRQLAGKEISELMQVLDGLEGNIDDLVVGEFRRSNPSFVEGYLIAKRIDDPGYRRTLLLLSVKNQQGLPVAGAWCDILEMDDEEQLTNNLGVAEIGAIKTGTYQLEVSKDGYQTFKTVFSIKRGQRISLEVVLQGA